MTKNSKEPVISLSNVCFKHNSFKNNSGSFSFDNLSLDVFPGTFVVFTGPNGSGKSTLALLLNGILKPSSGTVKVGDLSTSDKKSLPKIRKKVGIVFQNPYLQFVGNTVEEDVAFGPENSGLTSVEIKKRVSHSLAVVGMSEFKDRNPSELSGGEAQKVAIAGVLATDPDILIFDEITSMLDLESSNQILKIIDTLKTKGKTIIFICHDPRTVLNADQIYFFSKGKIKFSGTYKDYILSKKYPVSEITELLLSFQKKGYPVDILLNDPESVCSHLIDIIKSNNS